MNGGCLSADSQYVRAREGKITRKITTLFRFVTTPFSSCYNPFFAEMSPIFGRLRSGNWCFVPIY
jgi:hypothetical protein